MKKLTINLIILSVLFPALFLFSCSGKETISENFDFSLQWNTYGVSSYDSSTGKLIKTNDATHPELYETELILNDDKKEEIRKLISGLDFEKYPENYSLPNSRSIPPMTLCLVVDTENEHYVINAENIAQSFESDDPDAQKFLDVCSGIIDILTSTDEWMSLPDYEFLYE